MEQNTSKFNFEKDEYESLFIIRDLSILIGEKFQLQYGHSSEFIDQILLISNDGIQRSLKKISSND